MTKKITLTLLGLDGNGAAILGAFAKQAKREGWTPEEIKAVTHEAKSGDYDHLLSAMLAHYEEGEEL